MSNPRIIAGKARGIRLLPVPGDITRPITDRVKEALFNIIGTDIQGSSFLDLFGGTGSVGLEALSRGAAYVRFIDINRQAIQTIKANLERTRLDATADIFQLDAFNYLNSPPDRQFDYIYIAPPQYKNLWVKALTLLDQNPAWLFNNSWVIVQIDPVELQPVHLVHLHQFDQRKYGSTILLFFEPFDTEIPAVYENSTINRSAES